MKVTLSPSKTNFYPYTINIDVEYCWEDAALRALLLWSWSVAVFVENQMGDSDSIEAIAIKQDTCDKSIASTLRNIFNSIQEAKNTY